jgi:hypothetical protein
MDTVTLHHGDALDVLRTLESDSIHALVCDTEERDRPRQLDMFGEE